MEVDQISFHCRPHSDWSQSRCWETAMENWNFLIWERQFWLCHRCCQSRLDFFESWIPPHMLSFSSHWKWSESLSVVSDSLRLHGLYSSWNSPGQSTGEGSLSLLQGIFPTQGMNPGLPHCRQILYQLSHQGSPRILEWVAYSFSSRSFQPRNGTGVSCIAGRFCISWTTREALALISPLWIRRGYIHIPDENTESERRRDLPAATPLIHVQSQLTLRSVPLWSHLIALGNTTSPRESQSTGPEVRKPGFWSWLCYTWAVWLRALHCTSLGLRSLTVNWKDLTTLWDSF